MASVQYAFATPTSDSTWMDPIPRNGALMYRGPATQQLTPDSVFAPCGIQFRLVNYFELQTDDAHVDAWTHAAGSPAVACDENNLQVTADPRYLPGVPLVIVMFHSVVGTNVGTGVTSMMGSWASCASYAANPSTFNFADIAHELAHQIGHSNLHCTASTPNCRLMHDQGSDGPALQTDCNYMLPQAPRLSQVFYPH